MRLVTSLLLAVVALFAIEAFAGNGNAPPQPAGGNFKAEDTNAPGDKATATVEVTESGAGALTVTKIKVNGVRVDSDDYTITDNGSSTPDVTFDVDVQPAAGDTVEIFGSTAGGSGTYTGSLSWS